MPLGNFPYTFAQKTKAKASEVNENFQHLKDFLNVTKIGTDDLQDDVLQGENFDTTEGRLKQTTGLIVPNADKILGDSYEDLPNATIQITADVAAFALVHAVFNFWAQGDVAPGSSAGAFSTGARGTLNVAGSDQAEEALLAFRSQEVFAEIDLTILEGHAHQIYRVPLAAGTPTTLKLRARRESNVVDATCFASGTRFLYQLVAQ